MPALIKKAIDDGSLACSPQTPSLIVGCADSARWDAIRTSLPYALLIQNDEWIVLHESELAIGGNESLACIVSAEAKRHLREVVSAEREEVDLLGNFHGEDSRSGRLDHRADGHRI